MSLSVLRSFSVACQPYTYRQQLPTTGWGRAAEPRPNLYSHTPGTSCAALCAGGATVPCYIPKAGGYLPAAKPKHMCTGPFTRAQAHKMCVLPMA